MTSITVKSIRGSAWTVGAQLLSRIFDLLTLLILARVLEPADFGLVAIAMSVIQIAEASLELPTTSVLIVTKQATTDLLATAFTLGLLRAAVVGVVSCLAGLLLAHLYGDHRLFILTSVLALAPGLRGLISPRIALLAQDFRFRPLFIVTIFGKATALVVAVVVASLTRSYWSIALATIMTPMSMVLLSYLLAPYRPKLSLRSWHVFSGYVLWNSTSQFLGAINWQLDRLLLPRYVGPSLFGGYVTSSEIVSIPIKAVAQPVIVPLLAGFSASRSSTTSTFLAAYLKALDVLVCLMLPMFVMLALFAKPLLVLFLGAKWASFAPIVFWLSLISCLTIPKILLPPVFTALERPRSIAIMTGIELVTKVPLLAILIPLFAIDGALLAHGLGNLVVFLASVFIMARSAGVPVGSQLRTIARPVLALLPMCLLQLLASPDRADGNEGIVSTVQLVLSIFLATATYVATLAWLWHAAGKPAGTMQIIRDLARSRFRSVPR